jgi:lipopolysaccharide/colanic/teichoic acid biosynthesis glycosyltransferase
MSKQIEMEVNSLGAQQSKTNRAVKRCFDILVGSVGLVVATPLLLIIAAAIYIDSPGPVFYRQQRLGRFGRRFEIVKFRKFPADWGSAGTGVTLASDPRMTRVGAFLERTKLDELPQLWNILQGDMSLVGPRPESLRYADLFVGKYEQLLEFTPGLVGPAQIAHRNESDLYPADEDPEAFYRRVIFPNKGDMDLAYFADTNVARDIVTAVRAVGVTLSGLVRWRVFWRRSGKVVLRDMALIAVAWVVSNLIKFSGLPPTLDDFPAMLEGVLIMPLFVTFCLLCGGCYRYLIQHFSWFDAQKLVLSATFGWMGGYLLLLGFIERHASIGLSVEGLVLVLGTLMCTRLFMRAAALARHIQSRSAPTRVLAIYGALPGGVALATWIREGHVGAFSLVGFIDDDPNLQKCSIHGVQILGRESDLRNLVLAHNINELWLSFRPDSAHLARLNEFCAELAIDLFDCCTNYPFSELARQEAVRGQRPETFHEAPQRAA